LARTRGWASREQCYCFSERWSFPRLSWRWRTWPCDSNWRSAANRSSGPSSARVIASSGCGSLASGRTGGRRWPSSSPKRLSNGIGGDSSCIGGGSRGPANPDAQPSSAASVRDLIRRMSRENPAWGAPRIVSELALLGHHVAEGTVAKYMHRPGKPPSQPWRTFLDNHVPDIAACDFFTVPTVTFRVLYVFVVLRHDRRCIVHFNGAGDSLRSDDRSYGETPKSFFARSQVGDPSSISAELLGDGRRDSCRVVLHRRILLCL
jgi:hypothetical protein